MQYRSWRHTSMAPTFACCTVCLSFFCLTSSSLVCAHRPRDCCCTGSVSPKGSLLLTYTHECDCTTCSCVSSDDVTVVVGQGSVPGSSLFFPDDSRDVTLPVQLSVAQDSFLPRGRLVKRIPRASRSFACSKLTSILNAIVQKNDHTGHGSELVRNLVLG